MPSIYGNEHDFTVPQAVLKCTSAGFPFPSSDKLVVDIFEFDPGGITRKLRQICSKTMEERHL